MKVMFDGVQVLLVSPRSLDCVALEDGTDSLSRNFGK